MADHVRRQVRAAVQVGLAAAIPALTLLKSNAKNIDDSLLPALRVLARGERVLQEAMSGFGVDREIDLAVIVNDVDGDNLDDVLDDWGAQLEPLVLQILDGGVIAEVTEYQGSIIELEGPGEQRSGAIKLSFRVVVQTPEGNPTTIE